jgi:phosphate transport system substrate-binding protein
MVFMAAFFMLLSGCSIQPESEQATQIVVPGTGACEGILQVLASEFNAKYPGLEVIIPKSIGTGGGIKAAYTEAFPLARVGRPLKGDELKLGLTFLPFANDAVVFAVGKNVGIKSLTVGQLGDIFKGKIVNWQELGGAKSPIRVLGRQSNESSLEIISQCLAPFKEKVFTDQAKIAFHDYEMVDLLNKFPTSIGFLTNSSAFVPGNTMKVIGIDSVAPTAENLRSRRYPLMATYGLVYKKGKLNNIAIEFIDFIFSEKGQRIIETHGLVPLARSR